jgi:hypothetical protein
MDIKSLFPSTQQMEVKLPNGETTGIVRTLQGQDTKAFRDAAKLFAAKQMERKDKAIDLNDLEKQRLELALVCLVDWDGIEEEGVAVPFSKTKARELLSLEALGFIIEQIEEFVTLRANFFRGRDKQAS